MALSFTNTSVTSVCSPGAGATTLCLSYKAMVLLAKLYNASHPNEPPIAIAKSRQRLAAAIDARLRASRSCGAMDEACWVNQPFAAKSQQVRNAASAAFKPLAPRTWAKNKNEWLSNEDIINVMSQYEKADPKFHFVGTFPIDFGNKTGKDGTCVSEEICHLNISKERAKGRTRLGFVFNTDPHTKGGQHWIAAYVGTDPKDKNYGVYYYDSVAKPTPPQIRRFMQRITRMVASMRIESQRTFQTAENRVRRQYKGTECGIFVMLFLISMRTQPFSRICTSMGTDDEVETFRSVLFRTEKHKELGE